MNTFSYVRTYHTARGYLQFLEFIGWVTIVIGALVALVGFTTGGMMSALIGQATFLSRVLSSVPGLAIIFIGLIQIVIVQLGRAHLDSVDMTRELLMLARESAGKSPDRSGRRNAIEPVFNKPRGQAKTGDIIKTYKGFEIIKTAKGVKVGKNEFIGVLAAEEYINRQTKFD